MTPETPGRTTTLWLCGLMHAFTHLYTVVLLPLYLVIQADFHLPSVAEATLLMTLMMVGNFAPSYLVGIWADRWNRKRLLTVGLAINASGMVGLAMAPSYTWALVCAVLAGFGGSFYHPAATALLAQLYPANTGRAFGLVGMGASAGFLLGPLYAGWRATQLNWRAPVLELGLAGLVVAGVFHWLAPPTVPAPRPPSRSSRFAFPIESLWPVLLLTSLLWSLKDFAGSALSSLGSLFLQKARGLEPAAVGLALSMIFLGGLFGNPLLGHLSDRGRQGWTALVLTLAAVGMALFPQVPRSWIQPLLLGYGFFFLASYPMIEASLMVAVPAAIRGRAFGVFLTVGGLVGNSGHWFSGVWVKHLGQTASDSAAYGTVFAFLALSVVASLVALPCMKALQHRTSAAL